MQQRINKKRVIKGIHIKSIIIALYVIAVLYTVFNLGSEYLGIPGLFYQGIFTSTVLVSFLYTIKWSLHKKTAIQILCILPLIGFNIYWSIDIKDSALYWFFWLLFLISLLKIVQQITPAQFDILLKHVPYVLLCTSILLLVFSWPRINESLPTKNSLGILSGASFIASTSIKKKNLGLLIAVLSLWVLNKSDSRSSMAFALAIVSLQQLMNFHVKHLGVYIIGLVLVVAFRQNIFNFIEDKMLKKEFFATNLKEAIESAQSERTMLLQEGWKIFKERPITGYGLKTDYQKGRLSIVEGHFTGVHNGYLETLIEVGLFLSIFIGFIVLKVLYEILKHIREQKNNTWYMFLLFGLIRAYGESYLYFNIGNMFSIIFIFLTIVLIKRPELFLSSNKTKSVIQGARKIPIRA